MTVAAVVFCCAVVLAFCEGFGSPAFASVIASDALGNALPFLGFLIVARFAASRLPARTVLVHRVHATAQALLVTLSYGWWWIEPHALLTAKTGGSLAAMAWLAALGAAIGLVLALAAERVAGRTVMREVSLGAWALFLIGGGRMYRAFDHVEAGARLAAAAGIAGGMLAVAVALYLLLRRRERIAAALPALAPAAAGLALLYAASAGTGASALSSRDSILLVVVDTLRADIADGRFASDPAAMPELGRIASSGIRFTQAVSPAPWTLPATVSLLSGWNPHRHGFGTSASEWEVRKGDPAAMYLAGALRDAGYLTAIFAHNPYLRPWFGFDTGFYTMRPYHGRAIDGVALSLDWLRGHMGAPSFAMLHLMDPHWPYEAPPGFGAERQSCETCDSLFATQFGKNSPQARAEITRRYAAEVHYTDAMLGRFYDTLAAGGALEHTWLVITADHGEELWEHGGFLHGHSLYDELLRVPLVIVPPRAAAGAPRGTRIDAQVRLEDVAATMLEIAGLDGGRARDGRSLLAMLEGKADAAERVAVAGYLKSPDNMSWAVRRPPWKAVVQPAKMSLMFDVAGDPAESSNLLFDPRVPEQRRTDAKQALASLAAEPQRLGLVVQRVPVKPGAAVPESDTGRQLRSLGYAH